MTLTSRRSILLLTAALVFGCGRTSEPPAAGPGDCADLVGEWTGSDWGQVEFKGCWGGYTDTYGTGPGLIDLRRTGPNTFQGTWSESSKRQGTLELTLSGDGRTITGAWTPDPGSAVGGKTGGSLTWTRK